MDRNRILSVDPGRSALKPQIACSSVDCLSSVIPPKDLLWTRTLKKTADAQDERLVQSLVDFSPRNSDSSMSDLGSIDKDTGFFRSLINIAFTYEPHGFLDDTGHISESYHARTVRTHHGRIRRPADGGVYAWILVICVFFANAIFASHLILFAVYLMDFTTYFGLSQATLGAIGALESVLMNVTCVFSGHVTKSVGCRVTASVGILLVSLGTLGAAFCTNPWMLLVMFGIVRSFGLGFINVPVNVIVQQHFSQKNRSLAAGLSSLGMSLGSLAFAPIHNMLIMAYGWRSGLILHAGITLQALVFTALLRPVTPHYASGSPRDPMEPDYVSGSARDHVEPDYVSGSSGDPIEPHYVSGLPCDMSKPISESELSGDSRKPVNKHILLAYQDIPKPTRFDQSTNKIYNPITNTDLSLKHDANRPTNNLPHVRIHHVKNSGPEAERLTSGKAGELDQTESTATLFNNDKSHKPHLKRFCEYLVQKLGAITGIAILNNRWFLLFVVCRGLASAGFLTMMKYTVKRAINLGLSKVNASLLLSINGLFSVVGRLTASAIGNASCSNRLILYSVCMALNGATVLLSAFAGSDAVFQFAVHSVYGLFFGAFEALNMTVITDLFGLDNLPSAAGWSFATVGVSSLAILPFAGWLYDETGNYVTSFLVGGAVQIFGSLSLLGLTYLQKQQRKLADDVIS